MSRYRQGDPTGGGGGGGGGGAAWTTLVSVDFTTDLTAASGITAVGPHNILAGDGSTVKGVVQAHNSGSFTLNWAAATGVEIVTTSTRYAGITVDLSGVDVETDSWLVDVVLEVAAMNTSTVAIVALGNGINATSAENVGMRVDHPSGASWLTKTRYYDGGTTNGVSSEMATSSGLYSEIALQIVPRGNWAWTAVWAEQSTYLDPLQLRDGSTYWGGQPGFDAKGAGTTVTGQFTKAATGNYLILGGTGGGTTRIKKYRVRRIE